MPPKDQIELRISYLEKTTEELKSLSAKTSETVEKTNDQVTQLRVDLPQMFATNAEKMKTTVREEVTNCRKLQDAENSNKYFKWPDGADKWMLRIVFLILLSVFGLDATGLVNWGFIPSEWSLKKSNHNNTPPASATAKLP